MSDNRLREILRNGGTSISTRLTSPWPIITEYVGITGFYDYVEYIAEYGPFTTESFENLARACEVHSLGSIVKIDFQDRGYVAQKALGAGIQGVLFADCRTAEDVRESIRFITPDTPQDGGLLGYSNYRWTRFRQADSLMDFAARVRDCVKLFMIEKKEAVDNIEEICRVPGVDMIQFGGNDFSMSMGRNRPDNAQAVKEAEERCIRVALRNGVQPRCEINSPEDAVYYRELGVRHFSLGSENRILQGFWSKNGKALAAIVR